ncbi:MAG: UDP-N-acetylmuramoyl-tripeptide--D-alanyl-D-alanine ligase [Rickettsiaceae bacterium]
MVWTIKQLEEALSIKLTITDGDFGKIQFNSLDVDPGDIFIALQGNRDGHDFIQDALNRGAKIAIISKNTQGIDLSKLIFVKDTFQALMDLAVYKRQNLSTKFIAVTGSVGKTSTKEALKLMLSAYGKTFASHGTFNNHIGVPLSLASIPNDAEYAVIEMGMNAKGELSQLSNLVKPDVVIITTISEGHIEFFESVEDIADAKCEILEGLEVSQGKAIINRDMDMYERCIENMHKLDIQNLYSFGERIDANIRLVSHELLEDNQLRLVYKFDSDQIEILLSSLPLHFAINFAGALAVIKALKLDPELAAQALCSFVTTIGRGKLVHEVNNGKEYQIIADYYNANPQSLVASLAYLEQIEHPSKVAILGDMRELGEKSLALHKSVTKHIMAAGVNKLFLVGEFMPQIMNNVNKNIIVQCFSDVEELLTQIDSYLQGGELILIKGSRGMQLEKVANKLGVQDAL